jgi:hypothetical protein
MIFMGTHIWMNLMKKKEGGRVWEVYTGRGDQEVHEVF